MSELYLGVMMLILTYAHGSNYWVRTWLFPWFELLIFAAVTLSLEVKKISLRFLLMYLLCSGISVFALTHGTYSLTSVENAAYSVLALLATVWLMHRIPSYILQTAMVIGSLVVMLGVLVKTGMGAQTFARGVFIGNPSMTGCLIACSVPLLLQRASNSVILLVNYIICLLVLASLYVLDSTLPWLTLCVGLLGWLAHTKKSWCPFILLGLGVAGVAALITIPHSDGISFLEDSGRFAIWKLGLSHWIEADWIKKLFGFGLGTTQAALPLWQKQVGNPPHLWTWYHNEVVQYFIELGIIGMGLVVWNAALFVRTAWKRDGRLFAVLCGMSVWAFFNYPSHMAFTALFCASALRLIYEQMDTSSK